MTSVKTREICKTAMMATLVFLGTFCFKIPSPNGYTHLGDCMIFIAVFILGGKKGALAGGIGAALADALGGYMLWVLPTFMIKAVMALIMFYVYEKGFNKFRFGWFIGAVVGGVFQIIAYTLIKIPFFDIYYAITRLPGLIIQTVLGIVIASVIVTVLNESGVIKRIREAQ